ncbi:hypothetical protein MLD38_008685 [Melastoma candidum]|uniref:Uncharacterized protein n=1 Tax=Melastoma candidum TaxID=119954 RepID=A0ACB9RUU3_9MYRT|nr:hypothetical protein MLD38_008685 [Melastoma candidum]
MKSSNLCDWSSPDGKLDWGVQVDELNKLRKSASLRLRSTNSGNAVPPVPARRETAYYTMPQLVDQRYREPERMAA